MNKEGNLQTYGFDSLMWMFGVNPPSAIDVKDNEPVFLFTDPKMKEALAYIHKMMEAKVVDPDWVTMNTPDLLDQKLFKGEGRLHDQRRPQAGTGLSAENERNQRRGAGMDRDPSNDRPLW
ncbi:hypothetical protein ACFTAO_22805 [Paenibacillus rhizoplanae]